MPLYIICQRVEKIIFSKKLTEEIKKIIGHLREIEKEWTILIILENQKK